MTLLAQILERKYVEVQGRRKRRTERELEEIVAGAPPPRSLAEVLSHRGGPVRLIAEVKRASPSAGSIAPDADPVLLALQYAAAGASAISVLTDGPGFGGTLGDLREVRKAVEVPLLRKDFIVDRYQLLEAREAGADAALLIVAALEEQHLRALYQGCAELGLEALVEVHDDRELDVAMTIGARLIGVNHRDLRTFAVDLSVSERLLPRIPEGVKVVAESGIRAREDIRRLRESGAANFLVGEALVRAPDVVARLRSFLEAG
jgi:indole-3-glycerol phosphate synthase